MSWFSAREHVDQSPLLVVMRTRRAESERDVGPIPSVALLHRDHLRAHVVPECRVRVRSCSSYEFGHLGSRHVSTPLAGGWRFRPELTHAISVALARCGPRRDANWVHPHVREARGLFLCRMASYRGVMSAELHSEPDAPGAHTDLGREPSVTRSMCSSWHLRWERSSSSRPSTRCCWSWWLSDSGGCGVAAGPRTASRSSFPGGPWWRERWPGSLAASARHGCGTASRTPTTRHGRFRSSSCA